MEIKTLRSHFRLPGAVKNPLVLIHGTAWVMVLCIAVFLGISFFRTVYSTVLSPKPIAESQLTSQQATLDIATLDAVTKVFDQQKTKTEPAVSRDFFLP